METLAMSNVVRNLLAGYVLAQAVRAGTLMTDLGRGQEREEVEEEDATAITIASILEPDMVRRVKAMQAQPRVPPPNTTIPSIVTMLLGGSAEAGEEMTERLVGPPPSLNKRTMEKWFPKMGSPVGGIVSLLALVMGTRESLGAMAKLWVEVARELRWRWDQAEGEDIKKGLATLMGVIGCRSSTNKAPDLTACLLHQKLQVLDLCMRRRGGVKADEPLPPTTPPTFQPPNGSTTKGEEGEEEEAFFDTVGEEETTIREGALHQSHLKLLKSSSGGGGSGGGVVWVPSVQEPCPMTEDGCLQQVQLLQRVGTDELEVSSSDASSPPTNISLQEHVRSQLQMAPLVSDMQAFKAANPEGVLADFLRWKYPDRWIETTSSSSSSSSSSSKEDGLPPSEYHKGDDEEGDGVRLAWPGVGFVDPGVFGDINSDRGELIRLWKSCPPLSASKQRPLFNLPQEAEKVSWEYSLSDR